MAERMWAFEPVWDSDPLTSSGTWLIYSVSQKLSFLIRTMQCDCED